MTPRSAPAADAYARVTLLAEGDPPRRLTADSPLRDLFRVYLADLVAQGRRPWTLERYDAFLRDFLRTRATLAVRDLDRGAVEGFLNELSRRPGQESVGGRPLPLRAGTKNLRLVVLRGALRTAEARGVTPPVAPREVTLAGRRDARPLQRVPTPPEVARVLSVHAGLSVDDLRARALIEVLRSTRCSVREAVALDRAQVETRHRGRVRITDTVTIYDGRGRPRTAALSASARDALARYLAARTDASPALFHSRKSGRDGDRRLQVRFAERIVAGALRRAGLAGRVRPGTLALAPS